MYKRRLTVPAQPAIAPSGLLRPAGDSAASMRALLWLAWATAPVALLLVDTFSNLDLVLADRMFDAASGAFPWRDAWLTEVFGHQLLKAALTVFGVASVLLCGWDLLAPIRRWNAPFRLRARVVAASAIAVPAVIGALKSVTAPHCPWDLARYGGAEPYYRLLDAIPPGIPAGHCFPAGHASSALWLVSLALLWWPHRPRAALAGGAATLGFGFAVGWLQQMRGAHFLSHTLWSMWIACTVVAALYQGLAALQRRRA